MKISKILFAHLIVFATVGIVSAQMPDKELQFESYVLALEKLEGKGFNQLLEGELYQYIRKHPDAAHRDEMHFKLATLYHERGERDKSFLTHFEFFYLHRSSRFAVQAHERLRNIIVKEKKYKKFEDRHIALLEQDAVDGEQSFVRHVFLQDMRLLQFELIRPLLLKAYGAYLEDYPNSDFVPEILFWRAELFAENGQPQDALSDFLKVTHVYKTSSYVTASKLKTGELLSKGLKEHQKAVLVFEEFLLEYPEDPQAPYAQYKIGKIQEERQKKYLEAINSYSAIAENYPASVEAVPALFEAARLYSHRFREYEQAIRVYTEIVRDFSSDIKAPYAMAEAARIYEKKLQDYLNAANVYFKVYASYPQSNIALSSLYAAAEISEKRLGDMNKASAYYRLLTEKFPDTKLAKKASRRLQKIAKSAVQKDVTAEK